jgi:hypothetical protein
MMFTIVRKFTYRGSRRAGRGLTVRPSDLRGRGGSR